MSDIRMVFDGETFSAGLALEGVDLATDRGLGTAIAISLFTHARLHPDDPIPEGEEGRGGWWGDVVAPPAAPDGQPWRTGSRLRLLHREKQTAETARRAESYCAEALAWIVAIGAGRSVDVAAEWVDVGVLALTITVTRPDGVPERFKHLWKGR